MMRLLTNRPWRALNHLTPIAYPKTLIPRRPYSSSRISKPLRILFAGSDEFSCTSLRAIHAEHLRNPELIASIDVLHQPPKKAGRGQSQLRFGIHFITLCFENKANGFGSTDHCFGQRTGYSNTYTGTMLDT